MSSHVINSTGTTISAGTPLTLLQALQEETKYTTTAKGAKVLATPQGATTQERVAGRVALSFKALRDIAQDDLWYLLTDAWSESPLDTMKLIFHLRDCRGGKGERRLGRWAYEWLIHSGKAVFLDCNLPCVPEYGRVDDLLFCGPTGLDYLARLILQDYRVVLAWQQRVKDEGLVEERVLAGVGRKTKVQSVKVLSANAPSNPVAAEVKGDAVDADTPTLSSVPTTVPNTPKRPGLSLAYKWAPRIPKGQHPTRRAQVNALKAALSRCLVEMDQRISGRRLIRDAEYRQILSACSAHGLLLERLMCEKRWSEIDFNTVPGCAMHLYGKNHIKGGKDGSFKRRQPERFTAWREALAKGVDDQGLQVSVKASQVFIHSLVAEYLKHEKPLDPVVEAQWSELVKQARLQGTLKALCVSDVSGSMTIRVGGPDSSLTALTVSIALGIFCARVAQGPFHNTLVSFSERPQIHLLHENASLYDQVQSVSRMDWGMNTNLLSVFTLLLRTAQKHRVRPEEMPEMIIMLSDMQFDVACPNNSRTHLEEIDRLYRDAGYARPILVFWNLVGSGDGFPAASDDPNTILLSGFSVSALQGLMLGVENMTPWGMLQKTVLHAERYARVTVPQA